MSKPESQSDDCDVICPYCKASYQAEGADFSEHEREEECFECGRTYILYDECTITHYTKPKETQP